MVLVKRAHERFGRVRGVAVLFFMVETQRKSGPKPALRCYFYDGRVWQPTRFAKLVLVNLEDGAHGAFLNAVATSDAGLFVHDLQHAIDNFDSALGAGIDTDAAADTFIGRNYRMRHG